MKKHLLALSILFIAVAFVNAQTTPISLTTSVTPANSCTPPCDGTATVNATGGTPPYTYNWSTNPSQTAPTATGLCPGTYSVAVFGSGGTISAPAVATVTITCKGTSSGTLTVTTSSTPATACTPPCDGTATANVTGGTPPYAYQWGTSPVQTTQTATGLCPGTYSLMVSDSGISSGPTKVSVTVTCQGTTGIANMDFANQIQIFPIPAREVLNIQFGTAISGNINVAVFSALGQEVINKEIISANFMAMDISNLPKGIYLAKFTFNNVSAVKTIIIQ